MWFFIIIFIVSILLFIKSIDYNVEKSREENKNIKKEYKELSETLENLKNECKQINELIYNIEEFGDEKIEYQSNEETIQETSYYDDTVSKEEIQQALENIQDDKLTESEIMFLKFMNNKATKINFSPRWEFQYNIKPRIESAKLLKLQYLMQSSWPDNVKNATTKELKEILKAEQLKVTGNKQELVERVLGNIDVDLLEEKFNKSKYILTDKGRQVIEKNKRLFMSNREKAGKEFEELTDAEYSQLQVFHKVNEYKRLKHDELSFDKGYTKNDILWSIYNKQKDIYIRQKDYIMVGVVYDCMCDILNEQSKYEQEIHFTICCMYFRVYEMLPSDGIIGDTDYYSRHMKKYCKRIKKLMKNCNKDIKDFNVRHNFVIVDIKKILEHYIPKIFLEFEKVNKFQQKVNQFIDT